MLVTFGISEEVDICFSLYPMLPHFVLKLFDVLPDIVVAVVF